MKPIAFGLSLVLLARELQGQIAAPPVEWSRLLGGDQWEFLATIGETGEGSFALQGTSYSGVSGTRTIPQAGNPSLDPPDFWTVHLDAQGNILRQEATNFFALLHTSDGGAVGFYQDFTLHMVPWSGSLDVVIARLGPTGEKLWSRAYGGSGDDRLTRLVELPDGGFLLAGTSSSPPSGNKTSANFGDWDYWLLRLDSQGEIHWDKTFGGSRDDYLNAFVLEADGSMILGGFSQSPPDGNKTSPQYGIWPDSADFWVVKLGADGRKQWENSYGGHDNDWLQTLRQTKDGGYMLAGWTFSYAGGNKTDFGTGGWIVRIDPAGSKLWDRTYGDGGFTYLQAMEPVVDGGFVVGGTTVSTAFTAGFMQSSRWIYLGRIDDDGLPLWEQAHLVGGQNEFVAVKQTRDRGFLIGGIALVGPIDRPHYDYLAVKLAPEDDDGDGVPNHLDKCPATPTGVVVDEDGCSIAQRCPCEAEWRNRGDYLNCVATASQRLSKAGRMTQAERREIIRQAARSDCGQP